MKRLTKYIIYTILTLGLAQLSACSWVTLNAAQKDGPPPSEIMLEQAHQIKPIVLHKSKYGNPTSYVVKGQRYYVLSSSRGYSATGIASWYGTKFQNHRTSSGEPYNMYQMTAAHRTLPIPCFVKVKNLNNGKQVVVKVDDRGPFKKDRLIDLSYAAAKKLGMLPNGTAVVKVTAINPEQTMQTTTMIKKHPDVFLQLGAYKFLANAERLGKTARKITHLPSIIEITHKNGLKLYRVEIGPINDTQTADQLIANLKHAGIKEAITINKGAS